MRKIGRRCCLFAVFGMLSLCLSSCTDGEDVKMMLKNQVSTVTLTTSPCLDENNEISISYGSPFSCSLVLKKESHEDSIGFETVVFDSGGNVILPEKGYSLVHGHLSEEPGGQYVYSDEADDSWICDICFDHLAEGKHVFGIECIPWWYSPMNGTFSSAAPHSEFILTVVVTK